jgi:hypothetical protein
MVTLSAKLAPGEEQTFVSAGEVFVLKERVSETLTLRSTMPETAPFVNKFHSQLTIDRVRQAVARGVR